ncbi:hypothetical protein C2E23DRAFT_493722 [Lenzites betulinus]|nr:hypothetical protein C2E23DRAFT_493722 [Lenzites betulinus]
MHIIDGLRAARRGREDSEGVQGCKGGTAWEPRKLQEAEAERRGERDGARRLSVLELEGGSGLRSRAPGGPTGPAPSERGARHGSLVLSSRHGVREEDDPGRRAGACPTPRADSPRRCAQCSTPPCRGNRAEG